MYRSLVPAILLIAIAAMPADGQQFDGSESDVAMLSVNAVIGGATAGVVALIRGEDVSEAFTAGAVGGALSFAGKRIATADFTASGLVGRQVAALGHAVVVDAGRGTPLLSEIWLPLGPLQVRVPSPSDGGSRGWDARLDVTSTAAMLYVATIPELELDWSTSAETGMTVFRAPRHRVSMNGDRVLGTAPARLVILSADADRRTLDHEVVHVIQQDFLALAWSYPAEAWLKDLVGADQRWLDHFPIGFAAPAVGDLISIVSGENNFVLDWMEQEAHSLSGTGRRWAPTGPPVRPPVRW